MRNPSRHNVTFSMVISKPVNIEKFRVAREAEMEGSGSNPTEAPKLTQSVSSDMSEYLKFGDSYKFKFKIILVEVKQDHKVC